MTKDSVRCTSVVRAGNISQPIQGKVRADFYKLMKKHVSGRGVLNKTLRERAEKESSTSGAKAVNQQFSKWKRSRGR